MIALSLLQAQNPIVSEKKDCTKMVVIMAVFVFLIYGNSFHGSWHLDDEINIVHNARLHLRELSPIALIKTWFAHPDPDSPATLYRPVASLSFGLNWYFGQDNVAGYHMVNIVIHLLVTILLYHVCRQLLHTPLMPRLPSKAAHDIALLAALLWAANPVHTQAVTYIVQRMAQLAALFYLVGIYFYLKTRLAASLRTKFLYGLICAVSFLCALGSKENAATFPAAILLLEVIFFTPVSRLIPRSSRYRYLLFFSLAAITAVSLFIFSEYFFSLLQGYGSRTFTLAERLLTQPRILLLYLSQLFYPAASRLSIEHDIGISQSLLEPWTTLPAILLCLLLLATGILQIRKRPLLAFGILFFFIGHTIESTILPLELIFEHRNYLPSLFLFLPVAAWVVQVVFSGKAKAWRRYALLAALPFVLFFLGTNTQMRNRAWATEESLWKDAMVKAPNSSRAALNLAKVYSQQSGRTVEALNLFKRAFHKQFPTRNYAETHSLNGQGFIHMRKGDYDLAVKFFRKSLFYIPNNRIALTNLVLALLMLDKPEKALYTIMEHEPKDLPPNILQLQGITFLKLNRPAEALETFRRVHKKYPLSGQAMTGIGKALSLLGYYGQAEFFLRQPAKFSLTGALCSIENHLLSGDRFKAEKVVAEMVERYPVGQVFETLSLTVQDPKEIPLNIRLLEPFVRQHFIELMP